MQKQELLHNLGGVPFPLRNSCSFIYGRYSCQPRLYQTFHLLFLSISLSRDVSTQILHYCAALRIYLEKAIHGDGSLCLSPCIACIAKNMLTRKTNSAIIPLLQRQRHPRRGSSHLSAGKRLSVHIPRYLNGFRHGLSIFRTASSAVLFSTCGDAAKPARRLILGVNDYQRLYD